MQWVLGRESTLDTTDTVYLESRLLRNSRVGFPFQKLVVLRLQEARGYFSQLGRSKAVRKKCVIFPLLTSYMGGHPFSACTSLVIPVPLGVK